MGWYKREELIELGFRSVGQGARVSTGATFYRPERMSIGDYARIDDQAMLTASADGQISIGAHVYVGPSVIIEAAQDVVLNDFSTIAGRVTIYGSSDDYLGRKMTNPTIPAELRGLTRTDIQVGRHAIIGTGSVVLPGGGLGTGTAVGALSLVTSMLKPFGIYVGSPARWIKERSQDFLEFEAHVDTE